MGGSVRKTDLADACGISTAAVAKWFRLDAPVEYLKPAHLFTVADLCGVEARWLALGVGPKTREPTAKVQSSGKIVDLPPRHLALIQAYRALPAGLRQPIRMLIETLHASVNHVGEKPRETRDSR